MRVLFDFFINIARWACYLIYKEKIRKTLTFLICDHPVKPEHFLCRKSLIREILAGSNFGLGEPKSIP